MSWSLAVKRTAEEFFALTDEERAALTRQEAGEFLPVDTMMMARFSGAMERGVKPGDFVASAILSLPTTSKELREKYRGAKP